MCAFAFLGPAAASPNPPPTGGKKLGIVHKHGSTGGRRAASRVGFDGAPVNPELQLTNHGGVVMKTQRVYLIFWAPTGYSYPSGYTSGVERWAQDVAADAGTTSNAYGALPQYGASYTFAYGGSVTDTNGYPASACSTGPQNGGTTCLTDNQLIQEIAAVQQANGWTGGLVNQFALILPPGVDTCYDDPVFGRQCSYDTFCAYHSWYQYTGSSTPYVYLNLPYEVPSATGCHTSDGSTVQPEPNGSVDVLISPLSHEEREAATDPTQRGWFDSVGNEADDKCYVTWGPTIDATGGAGNQLINGNAYEAQTEWSNALRGCYQVGAPTVSALSATSALPGGSIGITGTNFFAANGSTPTVKFNGIDSPSVTVDSPIHLTVTVPAGVHTGKVTVQALGGNATSAQSFGPTPAISSLTDTLGNPDTDAITGTKIVVHGTGFFGVTAVKFDGVAASFSLVAADGTSLRAVVPAAATTGDVTVTTSAGGTSAGVAFTVAPHIASFTPTKAPGLAKVTIAGTGLAGTTEVDFNGHPSPHIYSNTATSVAAQVPNDATAGHITVANGTDSANSAGTFTPTPAISSFSPQDGAAGTAVTITGAVFTGATAVKFGTVDQPTFTVDNAHQITTSVPSGFSSGKITVVAPSGTAVSTQTFTLTTATTVSPASAVAGVTLTISGKGLGSATSVDFVNHPGVALAAPATATSVKVQVPDDAMSGTLVVNTPRANPVTVTFFKALPKISGLSVVDGKAGDTVHVTGTNLLIPSTDKFGTVFSPSVVGVDADHVDLEVPGLPFSTGKVSITTPGGTAVSAQTFSITKVTGMTPTSGAAGATITITGQGLGSANSVDFATHSGVTPSSTSATAVKVTVPVDAGIGTLTVHTANGASATTSAQFKPVPKITGFSASPVQAGDLVTILGSNLEPDGNPPSAKLGAVPMGPGAINTNDSAMVRVPDAGLTGLVMLTTVDGTATSPTTLKIRPTIDALDGTNDHGKAGDHVTLTGKTFKGTTSVKFGTVAASFTVAADGTSLTLTVPATAVNGPITVTNAGGSTDSDSFAVTPVIKSFTPTSGPVGATVAVTGTGFDGADLVTFGGGFTAVPTDVTPTSLKVVAPPGAGTGAIKVHTSAGGDSALSATPFTVTFSVQAMSPTTGLAGDTITLTGVGLTGVTEVDFNGHAGTSLAHSGDSTLTVAVPSGGDVSGTVTVTEGTTTIAAPGTFTLLTLDSFSPATGMPGTHVVIQGHGFGAVTGVKFNGVSAVAFTKDSDTQITATVPAGAGTGTVEVDIASGNAQSTSSFTVQAELINEVETDASGFIELYNPNSSTVDLSGAKLVFRPAGATDSSSDVQLHAFAASTTVASHQFTLFDVATLNTTGGGIALVLNGVIVDSMGYGTATNAFVHTAPAPAPATGHSIARSSDGTDTGDDSADFVDDATPTPGASNG